MPTLLRFVLSLCLLGGSALVFAQDSYKFMPHFVEKSDSKDRYSFAIHPLHNPIRLFSVYQPLIDYLNKNIPNASFYLESSRDYPAFDKKLELGSVDFALPNPYQTMIASEGKYRVFGKMGDDYNFRGIILIPKDSTIKTVADLKGKTISYPAPTALAATMMPQMFLYEHGLDVIKDTQSLYVGSQESSIMNAFEGKTDAAATWPPPWEVLKEQRPEIADKLMVKWETQSLPNNGLVVHRRIPDALVAQVKQLMLNLHKSDEGRAILQRMFLSKFESADNETYLPVKRFITQFTETIRDPSKAR